MRPVGLPNSRDAMREAARLIFAVSVQPSVRRSISSRSRALASRKRLHLRWHAAFSSVSAITSSARERRIFLCQNLPKSTIPCAAPGYFGSSVCGEVPSAIQQLSAGAYTPSSEAGSDEQYISSVSIPASVRAEFIRFIRLDLPVPGPPFIIYVYPPE